MIYAYPCDIATDEGGELVAAGYPAEVWQSDESLTAQYLRGDRAIPIPERRREPTGRIAVKVINHLGDEVMKVFGV